MRKEDNKWLISLFNNKGLNNLLQQGIPNDRTTWYFKSFLFAQSPSVRPFVIPILLLFCRIFSIRSIAAHFFKPVAFSHSFVKQTVCISIVRIKLKRISWFLCHICSEKLVDHFVYCCSAMAHSPHYTCNEYMLLYTHKSDYVDSKIIQAMWDLHKFHTVYSEDAVFSISHRLDS